MAGMIDCNASDFNVNLPIQRAWKAVHSERNLKLTAHHFLLPSSIMHGAFPPFLLGFWWRGASYGNTPDPCLISRQLFRLTNSRLFDAFRPTVPHYTQSAGLHSHTNLDWQRSALLPWLRFFLPWLRVFLPWLRFFLPWLRFFRAFLSVVSQMPG